MELSPDKEAVVVKAEFEPLVLDTMTKFGDKQEVGWGEREVHTHLGTLLTSRGAPSPRATSRSPLAIAVQTNYDKLEVEMA